MKLIKSTNLFLIALTLLSCKNEKPKETIIEEEIVINKPTNIKVVPITHGTLVLETSGEVIYIDPTGGSEAFKDQKRASLVLITDIHGDHLSQSTLEELKLNNVTIIGPKAVTDKIPSTTSSKIVTLNNNDTFRHNNVHIEAVPMYNLREEALKFHEKGRGNGYVVSINEERVYISGDTEDIPEMRNLKNIDKAFVCMNLPYTMPVESAADAVLAFKPKTVYPYHYRGTSGLSNIDKFKKIVNESDKEIEVLLLDWY